MAYNYLEAIVYDIKGYVADDYTEETLIEKMKDREAFAAELDHKLRDLVTGNGQNSYTCDEWQAEENLAHNIDFLFEALDELGYEKFKRKSAEWADVTIRCYLFPQAIEKVLDEYQERINYQSK